MVAAFWVEGVVISVVFGLVVFVLLSVVVLTALYLHPRLPDHQLSKETQDAVKMAVGMVVVLSALVLGLLIASVKNTFDTATHDLKHFSTQTVLLDHTLRAYKIAGGFGTDAARALCGAGARRYLAD